MWPAGSRGLVAVLSLTVFLKLFKYANAYPTFGMPFRAISEVLPQIISIVLTTLGLICGFATSFICLFPDVHDFSSLQRAFFSLVMHVGAAWDPEELFDKYPVVGRLWLTIFTISIVQVVFSLLIAVVQWGFEETRQTAIQGTDKINALLYAHFKNFFLQTSSWNGSNRRKRNDTAIQSPHGDRFKRRESIASAMLENLNAPSNAGNRTQDAPSQASILAFRLTAQDDKIDELSEQMNLKMNQLQSTLSRIEDILGSHH